MTVMKSIFMKQNLVAIAFWLMTGLCSSTTALAQWRADALVPETGKDYAVVAFSANLMREEPAFEAEMGDQALMGTVVEILDRKGSWVQIRTGEPYTAWVTELGLVPMDAEALKAYLAAPKWICTAAVTRVYDAPPAGRNPGAILCELVAGNLVRAVQASRSRKGYTPVLLPDGRTGWVCAKEVAPFDAWASAYGASRTVTGPTDEGILSTARRFLGVPYMWGGTSIKNVDCSGLTRSTFFLNGILLPRNASQQAHCGIPVEPADGPRFWESLQPGDLVFWGREATADKPAKATHVGIYIGDSRFIHASHVVRINSFDREQPDFYDRKPLCFKRILGQQDLPGTGILSVKNSPYYFPLP